MPKPCDSRIVCVQKTFREYAEPIDVAFVSWPANYACGLTERVLNASCVIVVSKNTDGTACATPAFYRHLLQRRLLSYVPDVHNCLIVTGPVTDRFRKPTGEELAAIQGDLMTFEESEAIGVREQHGPGADRRGRKGKEESLVRGRG